MKHYLIVFFCPFFLFAETEQIGFKLNVLFSSGSARINARYHLDLRKVGNLLEKNRTVRLLLEGHTDSIGSVSYNNILSQRRVDSIKLFLLKNYRVDPLRIISKGYGPSVPIARNSTPEGRAMNRRVDGQFRYPKGSVKKEAVVEMRKLAGKIEEPQNLFINAPVKVKVKHVHLEEKVVVAEKASEVSPYRRGIFSLTPILGIGTEEFDYRFNGRSGANFQEKTKYYPLAGVRVIAGGESIFWWGELIGRSVQFAEDRIGGILREDKGRQNIYDFAHGFGFGVSGLELFFGGGISRSIVFESNSLGEISFFKENVPMGIAKAEIDFARLRKFSFGISGGYSYFHKTLNLQKGNGVYGGVFFRIPIGMTRARLRFELIGEKIDREYTNYTQESEMGSLRFSFDY